MAGNDEKTEQATPRRIHKARMEGNFPVSGEILASLYLLAAIAIAVSQGNRVWRGLALQMSRGIQTAFRTDLSLQEALTRAFAPNLPLWTGLVIGGGVLVAAAAGIQLAQTGFQLAAAKLKPDLARLNPWPRLRQMPEQNRHQLLRAVLLLPVVGLLLQSLIARHWFEVLSLPAMPRTDGVARLFGLTASVLWQSAAVLAVVGLLDFAQRHRRYHRDLRMSRQDIRDESKEMEGNVQAKAQARRVMRDFVRRKMMSQVPRATAVIVNPTHYAVAVYYVAGESPAPQVLAKGKNYLAARIRAAAAKHGVPVVENPPLARSLYRSAEVGQEIPAALYRAVAEVLAYVYRMTNGRFHRGQ